MSNLSSIKSLGVEQGYKTYESPTKHQEIPPEELPSQQEWQNFVYQLQWALQEKQAGRASTDLQNWIDGSIIAYNDLFTYFGGAPLDQLSSNWGDPASGGQPGGAPQDNLPPGAIRGAQGNIVFNGDTAEVPFIGSPEAIDAFSPEVNIHVPPTATVKIVQVEDTRTGETIYQVHITDSAVASGQTQVINLQDIEHQKVNIIAPEGVEVQMLDGSDVVENSKGEKVFNVITPEEYSQIQPGGSTGQEGVKVTEIDDTTTAYEAETADVTMEFKVTQKEGETPGVHLLDAGNANISIPPSCSIGFAVSDRPGYDFKAAVLDKDGNVIETFYWRKPFKVNANATQEYAWYVDANGQMTNTMPPEFKDFLTINGGVTPGGATGHSDDTQPDETTKSNLLVPGITDPQKVIYNTKTDVSITADPEDNIVEYTITAPGTVNITATRFDADISVDKMGEDYYITVTYPDGKTEYILIDPQVTQININGGKITLKDAVKGDSKIKGPGIDAANEGNSSEIFDGLIGEMGVTEERFLNDFRSHFGGDYPNVDTVEELKSLFASGDFPPANPSDAQLEKIIEFFAKYDDELKGLINSYGLPTGDTTGWTQAGLNPILQEASERLVALLQKLYPNTGVNVTYPESPDSLWWKSAIISFNGEDYYWTNSWKAKSTGKIIPGSERRSIDLLKESDAAA